MPAKVLYKKICLADQNIYTCNTSKSFLIQPCFGCCSPTRRRASLAAKTITICPTLCSSELENDPTRRIVGGMPGGGWLGGFGPNVLAESTLPSTLELCESLSLFSRISSLCHSLLLFAWTVRSKWRNSILVT